ncbi:hypothetical protein M0L20_05730 [Spirosoma sp. RP8]|uniref:DUF3823 domain-containing protein n=1 Tax=Spirosoma liriopis TaxID=2937440 RepID=A0ABT0HGS1_9BACT|nr:hypothetical protein [Spirosoma liriopis]MCK8491343.1 hypothetical protein [Spirosoma liriopis]
MQRQLIQPCLLVLTIVLTLSSCFNEPDYPDAPSIDFKGVFRYPVAAGQGVGQPRRDSVVITIGFKDGDGNMGNDIPLAKADSLNYAQNGGWGNYEIRTFRLVNRQYVEARTPVNNFLFFPDLTKGKPKGAIEGTLDFSQLFPYGNVNRMYPTKFQIRIRDRSLNASNVIETDTISLPYPD